VIVLDTHTWLWWASAPRQLGRLARRELERAKWIAVPAICCLEVATLVTRGRITLDRPTLDWLEDALDDPRVDLLSLSPAVAAKAASLDAFHGDPADRLIVASAILYSAKLVTKDARIRAYGAVESVWE
jgi:PIN domain nuclease of toxin-antitoxin system